MGYSQAKGFIPGKDENGNDVPRDTDCVSEEKNPSHFCDCGRFLGHRGFCSNECHNKHYDQNCVSDEVKE